MNVTPEEHKHLIAAGQETVEKLGQSAMFLSLLTPAFANDPLCAMQLGYAILMNKPMYFAVEEGTEVPDVLRRLAEKIVFYKKGADPAAFERTIEELLNATVGQG